MGKNGTGYIQQADYVGIELADDVVPRKGFQWTVSAVPRIVYQNVDASEFLDAAIDGALDGCQVRDIQSAHQSVFKLF